MKFRRDYPANGYTSFGKRACKNLTEVKVGDRQKNFFEIGREVVLARDVIRKRISQNDLCKEKTLFLSTGAKLCQILWEIRSHLFKELLPIHTGTRGSIFYSENQEWKQHPPGRLLSATFLKGAGGAIRSEPLAEDISLITWWELSAGGFTVLSLDREWLRRRRFPERMGCVIHVGEISLQRLTNGIISYRLLTGSSIL